MRPAPEAQNVNAGASTSCPAAPSESASTPGSIPLRSDLTTSPKPFQPDHNRGSSPSKRGLVPEPGRRTPTPSDLGHRHAAHGALSPSVRRGTQHPRDLPRLHPETHHPLIGDEKVGKVDAELLDSLYAELRRCQAHCTGAHAMIDHRAHGKHTCDGRCRPHQCKPLAASSIRRSTSS